MRQMKAKLNKFNLTAFLVAMRSLLNLLFNWLRREVNTFQEAFTRHDQFKLNQTDCTGVPS
jgi:hypothetical protein